MISINKIYNPHELKNENGREFYFDNLKFILIFLVIIGHFVEFNLDSSKIAQIIWIFIYSFHMPLFVFISGYFAKNTVKNKNYNKCILFFILFFIMKIIKFIIDRICGRSIAFDMLEANSIPWYIWAMGVWYLVSIISQNIKKKYMYIIIIVLALIVGLDKNIGAELGLSRVIVFYPFFYLGLNMNREPLMKIIKNKKTQIAAIALLAVCIAICIIFINQLNYLKPILLGSKPYSELNNTIEPFGILFRAVWYIIAVFLGIAVMSLVPRGKTLFTKIGENTISIYFYHFIIFRFGKNLNIDLRVYQEILLAIIAVLLFSTKLFVTPLNKFLKLQLFESEGKEK